MSSRNDIVVSVDAGGRSSPMGQFHREAARITLNADRVFADVGSDTFDISDPRTRAAQPAAMGVLLHELGHAEHTYPRGPQQPETAQWASLLEEPRIERLMIGRHPLARRWLRTSAATTAVGDLRSRQSAAEAAILVLGRIDAGVFTDQEVGAASNVLDRHFTTEEQVGVRQLIAAAVALDDNDIEGMIGCAQTLDTLVNGNLRGAGDRWAEHTDDDSADSGHIVPPQSDPFAVSLHAQLAAMAAAPQNVERATVSSVRRLRNPVGTFTLSSPVGINVRPPTSTERAQADGLSALLHSAATRPVAAETVAAAAPPGRLSGTELVRRSVQRSRGSTRSATPWITVRRRRPAPASLALAVIVDRSDSMESLLESASSVAWTLQQAVAVLPGSRSRLWAFGATASLIPVDHRGGVATPTPGGGSNGLPDAVRLADQWLSTSVASHKLVVVLTDEGLPNHQAVIDVFNEMEQQQVSALWATPGSTPRMQGLPAAVGSVPWAATPRELGNAIAAAIREAG